MPGSHRRTGRLTRIGSEELGGLDMLTFGVSVQGKYHKELDLVCQDDNRSRVLTSGYYMAIVADGVGSAPHADVGAQIAVDRLFRYCDERIQKGMSPEQQIDILRDGYEYAFGETLEYVDARQEDICAYDTTLSSVIYDGQRVVFGHAGDGGIIVRYADGLIAPVTKRQKGADGISVIPLRAGADYWEFGYTTMDVAGVLLATDGLLDGIFQPTIVNLPQDREALLSRKFSKDNVYITAVEFFLNPHMLFLNRHVEDPHAVLEHFVRGDLQKDDQEQLLRYLINGYEGFLPQEGFVDTMKTITKYYYLVWALTQVQDDKTVAGLINDEMEVTAQNITYYQEIDWVAAQKLYLTLLYGQDPEKASKPGQEADTEETDESESLE